MREGQKEESIKKKEGRSRRSETEGGRGKEAG
jgi:hypothetical protein